MARPRRDPPEQAPRASQLTDAQRLARDELEWLTAALVAALINRHHEPASLVRHEAARLAALDDPDEPPADALAAWACALPVVGEVGRDGMAAAQRALRNHRMARDRPRRPRIRVTDP